MLAFQGTVFGMGHPVVIKLTAFPVISFTDLQNPFSSPTLQPVCDFYKDFKASSLIELERWAAFTSAALREH